MKKNADVVIIGGGLAGLTCGIHLSKMKLRVILIEKNEFPKHKVCGEYVSNEIKPYLDWLDLKIQDLNPTTITELEFSSPNGKLIHCDLPLGGFGISRYALDYYLYQKAIENGCEIIHDSVEDIHFKNDVFTTSTSDAKLIISKIAIGAFGKRSSFDQKLQRNFILKKAPWLAVKGHYKGNFSNSLVGLYNFEGGYCGVSKVENNIINICYLVDFETFKKFKNIDDFQINIMYKNKHLKQFFTNSTPLFEKPLTISQISFEEKTAIENHILMVGDSAGLIQPLCGNGMAMAIHSAKIASELITEFFSNTIRSRKELEDSYIKSWNYNFKERLKIGRFLAAILQNKTQSTFIMWLLIQFPLLLPQIIKRTHGKPIIINY
ncbi:NAD(P)/FAD-dependent oxidoreductase [Flavobacterium hydatis]|uniref:FAD-dependent oxidoreductase n=1 Tax=Flavobacterium hydatis TaxID=991 RepID=A0A086AEF6_FLAHY|nr:NAD(P)/FAD-dependent oxidoreductase [Flavobacterium hydatis]KFF15070.1 FAD-dependent oxidoreductase [Flavobacterium hydatis]OXA91979.1 FAD-dependent oxidoreductase [Flavobacterium hydatis]